jgi:hypothetical protein
MTTPLEKDLRRALRINGADYVLTISPKGLKLTLKKKRNGVELAWVDLVDGDAALATALNASLGRLETPIPDSKATPPARSVTKPEKGTSHLRARSGRASKRS